MRTILIIATALFLSFAAIAQTGNAEAKAAYMLAEEAFALNDWKGTISYLEECKKKLGNSNSKILYLQVMTELELAKTEPAYNEAVLKSIAAFEKTHDIKDFNEEKVLEVMKAKLRVNRLQEQAAKLKRAKEEREQWLKTQGGMVVVDKDGHGFVMANTDIGKMNQEEAKKACEDLVLNGYNDWRLPTWDEVHQMIAVSAKLSTTSPPLTEFVTMKGIYWSTVDYGNSTSGKKIKKQANSVRPVRSF